MKIWHKLLSNHYENYHQNVIKTVPKSGEHCHEYLVDNYYPIIAKIVTKIFCKLFQNLAKKNKVNKKKSHTRKLTPESGRDCHQNMANAVAKTSQTLVFKS